MKILEIYQRVSLKIANQIASNISGRERRVQQIAYRWNNEALPVESGILFKALMEIDPANTKDALTYAISLCQANETGEASRLFVELLLTNEAEALSAWNLLVRPDLLYKYDEVT